MKRYSLILTREQVRVMNAALELFSRIGQGQLHEVTKHHDHNRAEEARPIVDQLKMVVASLGVGCAHGISSPAIHDQYRTAYDMEQVLRRQLAIDDKVSGPDYRLDPPLQYGLEPLAKIKPMPALGERLNAMRIALNMTLAVAADALKVSVPQLCNYEHDRAVPSKEMLERMAKFYGADPDILVALSERERVYYRTPGAVHTAPGTRCNDDRLQEDGPG